MSGRRSFWTVPKSAPGPLGFPTPAAQCVLKYNLQLQLQLYLKLHLWLCFQLGTFTFTKMFYSNEQQEDFLKCAKECALCLSNTRNLQCNTILHLHSFSFEISTFGSSEQWSFTLPKIAPTRLPVYCTEIQVYLSTTQQCNCISLHTYCTDINFLEVGWVKCVNWVGWVCWVSSVGWVGVLPAWVSRPEGP